MSKTSQPVFGAKVRFTCAQCRHKFEEEGVGTGVTIRLPTETGPAFFCSLGCQSMFTYNRSLVDLTAQAFRNAGIPNPELVAQIFTSKFAPLITELPAEVGSRRFRITGHPDASLLSCIIGGDGNFRAHVDPGGCVHTPLRINDFALMISRAHPSALLIKIGIVRFTKEVPLGTPVIITVKSGREKLGMVKHEVSAVLDSTGESICEPTTVTTYKA